MGSTGDSSGLIAERRALPSIEPEPEPKPNSGLSIDVVRHGGNWTFLAPIDSRLSDVAAALSLVLGTKLSNSSASVALSSDAEVRRLNKEWRGRDEPTNVLSFPSSFSDLPQSERRFLGDIVLAEETVVREAEADDIPSEHNAMHLVVHGVLHLVGYDHMTEAEAAVMAALEAEVLAKLGISDPYR